MIFGLFGGYKIRAAEMFAAARCLDAGKISQLLTKETNFSQINPEFSASTLRHEINGGQFHVARELIVESAKANFLSTDGMALLNIEASSEDACLPVMQALTDAGADSNFSPDARNGARIPGLYDATALGRLLTRLH